MRSDLNFGFDRRKAEPVPVVSSLRRRQGPTDPSMPTAAGRTAQLASGPRSRLQYLSASRLSALALEH